MKNLCKLNAIGLALTLVLAGCSSGGPGGGSDVTTDNSADNEQIANDDGAIVELQSPEVLALGAVRSGFVAEGESQLFRVPSGSTVSLTSSSGDADLLLFGGEELTNENLLCNAGFFWQEENCTATVPGAEMFALIFGRSAATFNVSVSNDCSVVAVNEWVYRNMQDYYLFADNVPVINPTSYESTSDLMRDLRFESVDPYSGVSDAVTQQEFFESGGTFGFGFSWQFDAAGNPRIIRVYEDSPMGRAGISRGDIIVGLNDELWVELTNERFFELIGDRDNPLTNTWRFIDGVSGEPIAVPLVESEFTLNSVLFDDVYTNTSISGSVGYLVFDSFIEPSEAELDAAFSRFVSAGVTELVLDLRYNSGGRTSIARRLASQIAGPELDGSLLVRYEYNDKYSAVNFNRLFEAATPSLDLDRVVVLTTGRSASSSELVINSLKPYMEVVVIGESTNGKSFISRAKEYCGIALNAMEAQGVNANGVSVVDGIAADCFAADDPAKDFLGSGGELEGMFSKAVDYLAFGTCDAQPALAKRATATSELSHIGELPYFGAVSDPVRVR